MPRTLAFHEVKDVPHWLSSPKREEFFGPLGCTEIKTYVDPEGSKRVGVTMNIADIDAVMAASCVCIAAITASMSAMFIVTPTRLEPSGST